MSKAIENDEMRGEYDFSQGIRGKHHQAYQTEARLVTLDPDVAKVFKDSDAVNHALRMLMQVARDEIPTSK